MQFFRVVLCVTMCGFSSNYYMDDMYCWYSDLTSNGSKNSVAYKGIEQWDWGGLGPPM